MEPHRVERQSPLRRGTHFYKGLCEALALIIAVSIPFTSGNSFLQFGSKYLWYSSVCVNPLHVGELISTMCMAENGEAGLRVCQSPSPRGTHFYDGERVIIPLNMRCQSPSPRGTHFYPIPYFLLILCGFPASISVVFSGQFWKRLFFRSLQHF